MNDDNNRYTIFWASAVIVKSQTDEKIDPGTVVPDIKTLLAQIDAMKEATASANSAISIARDVVANAVLVNPDVPQQKIRIPDWDEDFVPLREDVDDLLAVTDSIVETVDLSDGIIPTQATFDSNAIIYWSAGAAVTVRIPCKPNTTYHIVKTVGNRFMVAYTKEAPAKNVQTFGYTNYGNTATECDFTTGDDAAYLLIMAANSFTAYPLVLVKENTKITTHGKAVDEVARERLDVIEAELYHDTYACALPRRGIVQMVGYAESWYYAAAVTMGYMVNITAGSEYIQRYNKFSRFKDKAVSSSNGYGFTVYDSMLREVDKYSGSAGTGGPRRFLAENLSDCTLLAIGDSTIDHDVITAKLLSHFEGQGRTITLLGTRGDNKGTGNNNEGRAGWKALDYIGGTDRGCNPEQNPFYNPVTGGFDFAHYMAAHGYASPNFVVIQLGINDLYNGSVADIEPTWNAIRTMIDSIHAYNPNIEIILNLPTTPNADQEQHTAYEPTYRNRIIRYNAYAMEQAKALTNVRCSYCHLILDPDTDIRDNVHPTNEGYERMAMEIVNQINAKQNGY